MLRNWKRDSRPVYCDTEKFHASALIISLSANDIHIEDMSVPVYHVELD